MNKKNEAGRKEMRVHGKVEITRDCRFYFGDICYIMKEPVYDNFWGNQKDYADGAWDTGKGFFAVAGTKHRDGEYRSSESNQKYPVDAGVLGLVEDLLFDPKREQQVKRSKLGLIFELKVGDSIEYLFDNGFFQIVVKGSAHFVERVETDYQEDEDEYEDDDYGDAEDEVGDYEESVATEEFQIPGTEIIVEAGDRIRIKAGVELTELPMGQAVEMEHLPTYEWLVQSLAENGILPSMEDFAARIARDHLAELPDYYTRLHNMEQNA